MFQGVGFEAYSRICVEGTQLLFEEASWARVSGYRAAYMFDSTLSLLERPEILILHDFQKVLRTWEIWHYSILRSCMMFSSNHSPEMRTL